MRPVLLSLLLTGSVLAGCGQSPAEPPVADSLGPGPSALEQAPGSWQGPAPTTALPARQDATAALAQLAQTWSRVKTLSGHFDFWQVKGAERETAVFNFSFRKPYRYRYEVEKASSPIKNGSTAVFDTKTGDITARLGSIASIIPLKGKLTDERSLSVRGHRMNQGDVENLIKLLLAPGANVKLVSAPGAPVVLALLKPPVPITDELRIGLDARTGLIGSIEHVFGGKVVSRSTITNMKVNPTLDADKLSL
jgi:outer membrane lipoprotein-sorting protein